MGTVSQRLVSYSSEGQSPLDPMPLEGEKTVPTSLTIGVTWSHGAGQNKES